MNTRPVGLAECVYYDIRFKVLPRVVRRILNLVLLKWPLEPIVFRLWSKGKKSWNKRMFDQQLEEFFEGTTE